LTAKKINSGEKLIYMLVGSDNYRSQMELQICVTILYSSSRIVAIKNKNLI